MRGEDVVYSETVWFVTFTVEDNCLYMDICSEGDIILGLHGQILACIRSVVPA